MESYLLVVSDSNVISAEIVLIVSFLVPTKCKLIAIDRNKYIFNRQYFVTGHVNMICQKHFFRILTNV